MLKRFALTFLALSVVAVTLTGCAPQSRDSLDSYVEALDDIPGVDIDDYYVESPPPFSFAVDGEVELSFDADPETLTELQKVGCDTKFDASLSMSIAARAGETSVRVDEVDLCADLPADVVGLAVATEEFAVDITVDDGRASVDADDDLPEALEVLRVVTDFMPEGSVLLSASSGVDLEAPDAALAAAYLDDFLALVDEFGIWVIDLKDDTLTVQAILPADRGPVEEFLIARDAARYSAVTLVVTDLSDDTP